MKTIYHRNLPHLQYPEGIYFITFRLSGSLPIQTLKQWKNEQESFLKSLKTHDEAKIKTEKYNQEKRYFGKYDKLLDDYKDSPQWLVDDRIAKIVADKLHSFDNVKYDLICFCIMPNHVHLMFSFDILRHKCRVTQTRSTTTNYIVTDIMRLIKGSTSRECNKILNRDGEFWHHESYDHLVRDNEIQNIIRYILENPIKAGFVDDWEKWKWSYCNATFMS